MGYTQIRKLETALAEDGKYFSLYNEIEKVLMDGRNKTKVKVADITLRTKKTEVNAVSLSPKFLEGAKELRDTLMEKFTQLGYSVHSVKQGSFVFAIEVPESSDGEGTIKEQDKLASSTRRFTKEEKKLWEDAKVDIVVKMDAELASLTAKIVSAKESLNGINVNGTTANMIYGDMNSPTRYEDGTNLHHFTECGYGSDNYELFKKLFELQLDRNDCSDDAELTPFGKFARKSNILSIRG
jgi:hypothetical protein